MTKDVFDDDLHHYLNEYKYECTVCGTPIKHEGYCSGTCFEADLI